MKNIDGGKKNTNSVKIERLLRNFLRPEVRVRKFPANPSANQKLNEYKLYLRFFFYLFLISKI